MDADLVVNRSWILVARMALLRMQGKKKDEPLWGLKATDKEDPVEADNKGRRAALETIMLMWSWTHWLILM